MLYMRYEVGKPASREALWSEYEACRQGISDYDSYLFRIRQWNITLIGLYLGAVLGIERTLENGLDFAIASVAITGVSMGFWALDAMNKSLQMVHILNSRRLEDEISGKIKARRGPEISNRFLEGESDRIPEMVKNLTESSVWPFYIPPIILTNIILLLGSWRKSGGYESRNWPSIDAPAFLIAAIPILLIVIMWLVSCQKRRAELGADPGSPRRNAATECRP